MVLVNSVLSGRSVNWSHVNGRDDLSTIKFSRQNPEEIDSITQRNKYSTLISTMVMKVTFEI